ncbi:MAG: hypothetical protein QNI97_02690 [Desulfobacterales bacterium]|nr:hypothetical protein [Desulfobacterales bacterium]
MATYKKAGPGKTITVFASVGTLVAAGTIGCGGKASGQQDYMVTDIATDRINLDAVKDALETSRDLTEFENRVNEIYEGDNLVLIRVEGKEAQIIISGFEDLNQSDAIEEAKDEKLFSITVKEEKYEVYGHSTNDYYYYGGDYSDYDYDYDYDDDDDNDNKRAFMHWLMHSRHSAEDRIYHQTNRERAAQMRRDRDRFRSSSAYTAQRSANKAFYNQQKSRHPQAFGSRTQNPSSQRSTYRQKQFSRIKASRSGRPGSSMRSGS